MEKAIMDTPRVNVSTKKDYRTYYDDETIELVGNVDKTFIEKFGYTFEALTENRSEEVNRR
jgi:hypothetical protein